MADNPTPYEALLAAVDRAGSQSALARIVGCSNTSVWKWVQSSKRMPAEFVLKAEAATGVSRHFLRPDIYPVEVPHAPPAWHGVDLGTAHVSFQNGAISQRIQEVGAAA
jgi:DNA-binding transcriptional regulator YdaS (Cro superfamily)